MKNFSIFMESTTLIYFVKFISYIGEQLLNILEIIFVFGLVLTKGQNFSAGIIFIILHHFAFTLIKRVAIQSHRQ